MEVKVSNQASYTWRSICSARSLLKRGAIKVVGNGHSTRIWEDPWVPTLPSFKVTRPTTVSDANPYLVSELIEGNGWKEELVHELFSEEEAANILCIPLSNRVVRDSWMWKYTKNGDYSVRSAYYNDLEERRKASSSTMNSDSDSKWKVLGKTQLPPKLKNFGWRVLHGGLAVKHALAIRGIQVDMKCPKCGETEESLLHMLVTCSDASLLWRISPLRLEFDPGAISSMVGWTEELLKRTIDIRWWSLFWAIAWGIWKCRNLWVFEAKRMDIQQVLNRAIGMVDEYEAANTRIQKVRQPGPCQRSWTPPESSWYKVNVDAAIFEDGWLGFGAVLRDKDGDPLMVTCNRVKGGGDATMAEALAARFGLTTAIEAGFHKLVLETDSLTLANSLSKKICDKSLFGLVVGDILSLTSSCSSFRILHVRREGNRVAHALAKGSIDFDGLRVWLEEIPGHIQALVTDDISSLND